MAVCFGSIIECLSIREEPCMLHVCVHSLYMTKTKNECMVIIVLLCRYTKELMDPVHVCTLQVLFNAVLELAMFYLN